MSLKFQPVRGTHDILPEESRRRRGLSDAARQVFSCYGFGEIATPVFEFTDVFHRTLGDTSDVVSKETYTFTDRGGESLTLRPEFTASVVRALISGGLTQELPFKVFYEGAAFRYERPQKGRLRQFHQIGAELLGSPEPLADVEMIAMAMQTLRALGLAPHVKLELNSLGDVESRAQYRAALVEYLNGHRAQLSEDSKMRLDKNPLRVLDSKAPEDKAIVAGAPALADHFTPEARTFFASVQAHLTALGIAFEVNPRLVRGLDYYSHTVFEFTTESLGAQGTVLAGGRYDGLVKLMGGPEIAGVGFAAGIERLLALMEVAGHEVSAPKLRPVAVAPLDDAQEKEALLLTQELRALGVPVELLTRGNMGKKMKRAEKLGALGVFILGEEEVAQGKAAYKNMDNGQQTTVSRQTVLSVLPEEYKNGK
jgi:histidyl-tRNA synthetase